MTETWVPFAGRNPGPRTKVYYVDNELMGFVCHSMVGSYQGSMGRLMDPDDRVSWHFSLLKSGLLVQHYPLEASCWASSSYQANTTTLAMEAEGGYDPHDEPLTPEQEATAIRLWTWLEHNTPLILLPNINLIQHKQAVARWGGSPTACASDRYDEVWKKWNQVHTPEDTMIDEELRKAMLAREKIRRLASDPDIDKVYQGLAVLEQAGLV